MPQDDQYIQDWQAGQREQAMDTIAERSARSLSALEILQAARAKVIMERWTEGSAHCQAFFILCDAINRVIGFECKSGEESCKS